MKTNATASPKRVALLGLMLESNRFAPTTTREDFLDRLYLAGPEFVAELDKSASAVMSEMLGFAQDMTANTDWQPVPILVGRVEAGGPIDHAFYRDTLDAMRQRLEAAQPLDGVYVANHGAMITTETDDPDGEIIAMVRRVVGASVPVVVTLDLHANISDRMVEEADVIVGYRTNPHVDMIPRGAEAAGLMRAMWQGMTLHTAFARLPLVAPTVTLLTDSGPFGDLTRAADAQMRDDVANVSLFPGFAYGDTAKNGMSILATSAGSSGPAVRSVDILARQAWNDRQRFRPKLTSLADAAERCWQVANNPEHRAIVLADVADNPGGGGLGNTTAILRHLLKRGVRGALLGLFHDPELVRDAVACGEGRSFTARLNRDSNDEDAGRLSAEATVERVLDGECIGRRGIYAGRVMNLGPTVLLDVAGIKVVANTIRTQCADPVFFEMVGLDLARARVVVVKSRGHFRSGFDEFFGPDQVVEVDGPGLCSPVLTRFEFRNIGRPFYPVDEDAAWSPKVMVFPARHR